MRHAQSHAAAAMPGTAPSGRPGLRRGRATASGWYRSASAMILQPFERHDPSRIDAARAAFAVPVAAECRTDPRLALASLRQGVYLTGEVYSMGRLSARLLACVKVARGPLAVQGIPFMRKIILAAAVAGAALSLSACKGSDAASSDAASSADSAASDASAAASDAATAAASADSAAADASAAASDAASK